MGPIALIALAALSAVQEPPLAAAAPLLPPATIDDTLDVTGESVKARALRTRMTVGVTIADGGPYRFLVDSGADRSVIGADLAARLALPASDPVMLHSTAGTTMVSTVRLDDLKVGASMIAPIEAPVLPERFLGAQGLLGIDSLADQRLLLDFDAKTVTIQDTRRPPPPAGGPGEEIVVTARRRHGQLILTQASAGRTAIYAVIDSGAEVTLGNSALHARIFRGKRPPPATRITLLSVTGDEVAADLTVLPELTIGRVTMTDVPVAFADVPPFALFGLADQPSILLGTDLLNAFRRVSLDFRNRKVRFLLRR